MAVTVSQQAAMESGTSSPEAHRQDPDWERLLFESRLGSVLVMPAQASCSSETDRAVDVSVRGAKGAQALIHPEFRIFIGYDAKEDVAFQVCKESILKHASVPVHIVPIKQKDLRDGGLYTRLRDPTESTEFSFTRFLTPYLAGYMGWAMFVDCDFLYTGDIKQLVELIDDKYAVMCVKVRNQRIEPTLTSLGKSLVGVGGWFGDLVTPAAALWTSLQFCIKLGGSDWVAYLNQPGYPQAAAINLS